MAIGVSNKKVENLILVHCLCSPPKGSPAWNAIADLKNKTPKFSLVWQTKILLTSFTLRLVHISLPVHACVHGHIKEFYNKNHTKKSSIAN